MLDSENKSVIPKSLLKETREGGRGQRKQPSQMGVLYSWKICPVCRDGSFKHTLCVHFFKIIIIIKQLESQRIFWPRLEAGSFKLYFHRYRNRREFAIEYLRQPSSIWCSLKKGWCSLKKGYQVGKSRSKLLPQKDILKNKR